MKYIIVLSLVAVACAAPQAKTEPIPILYQNRTLSPDGAFLFAYETANNIFVQAIGAIRDIGAQNPALQIVGQFSYLSDDGQNVAVSYVADENGYVAKGNVIPTPPPIPADIQRALDYLATASPHSEN